MVTKQKAKTLRTSALVEYHAMRLIFDSVVLQNDVTILAKIIHESSIDIFVNNPYKMFLKLETACFYSLVYTYLYFLLNTNFNNTIIRFFYLLTSLTNISYETLCKIQLHFIYISKKTPKSYNEKLLKYVYIFNKIKCSKPVSFVL